jgi:putative nucleotidyltransferase with HDIG domain
MSDARLARDEAGLPGFGETDGQLQHDTVAAQLAELERAREQAVLYARDLSRAYHAERERSRELVAALRELQHAHAQLNQAHDELKRTYDMTLRALVTALDVRDSETEGHSERVVAYALALAKEMGCSGEFLEHLERGALLHDIGKIGVPDAILCKPGPLTEEEWVIMRRHPVLGYQMLAGIPFLEEARTIVLHHQEHYDGRGYPQGLRGEEIHLGARIFAVIDAFDALTHGRRYRPAVSDDEAAAEIARCSGTQFDPQVVQVFLRIYRKLRTLPVQRWVQRQPDPAS